MDSFPLVAQTVLCALRRRQMPPELAWRMALYVRAAMRAAPPPPPPPAQAVAAFYDRQVAQSRAQPRRKFKPTNRLREFHNWIKCILINDVCRADIWMNLRVLDVGSGKGGDLLKFTGIGVAELYTIDISPRAVEEAVERYNQIKVRDLRLMPIVADAGAVRLAERVPDWPTGRFHAATCQFALHYFFDCEAHALGVLQNIADALMPGKRVVLSFPDAAKLLETLSWQQPGALGFGNAISRVEFAERVPLVVDDHNRACCPEPRLEFGCAYRFVLDGAVDADEFVVWPATLLRLAEQVGLRFVSSELFEETAQRGAADIRWRNLSAYKASHARDGRCLMSAAESEVSGLYRSVVFVRTGKPEPIEVLGWQAWPRINRDAILRLELTSKS